MKPEERVLSLTHDDWVQYKKGVEYILNAEANGIRVEVYRDCRGFFLSWIEQDDAGNFEYMICRVRRKAAPVPSRAFGGGD